MDPLEFPSSFLLSKHLKHLVSIDLYAPALVLTFLHYIQLPFFKILFPTLYSASKSMKNLSCNGFRISTELLWDLFCFQILYYLHYFQMKDVYRVHLSP